MFKKELDAVIKKSQFKACELKKECVIKQNPSSMEISQTLLVSWKRPSAKTH